MTSLCHLPQKVLPSPAVNLMDVPLVLLSRQVLGKAALFVGLNQLVVSSPVPPAYVS